MAGGGNGMKVLVTGAGGFLGAAISRQLIKQGDDVVGLARGTYHEMEALGVSMFQGDITNIQDVKQASFGCDIVFHVAAKAGVWGKYNDYYKTNVTGTQNIIDACYENGINHLVYTSTPSVVFTGEDENGIDESTPYAKKHLCHYTNTKAMAEKLVLSHNGDKLKTVALRPHLIWGPGDNHLVPRIIARGKAGKIKLIGSVDKLVDCLYIDNAVLAHLAAANCLKQGHYSCAGKAYFISNDEPLLMKSLINKILKCGQVAPVTKRVNGAVAFGVGGMLEMLYGLLRIKQEPIMTRFVAKQLSCSHWFDISNAKNDLGYTPYVSIDEGMVKLEACLKDM